MARTARVKLQLLGPVDHGGLSVENNGRELLRLCFSVVLVACGSCLVLEKDRVASNYPSESWDFHSRLIGMPIGGFIRPRAAFGTRLVVGCRGRSAWNHGARF